MTFRKIIFWLHLACGLIAGVVIGIMSFTGAALAFEKEIILWVERDASSVTIPAPGTPRLSIDELVRRVRATQPDAQPASVIVKTDPAAAIAMTVGAATIYVNPYTGEIRPSGAEKTRAFMRVMTAWHRTIAMTTADNRALGKAITGACNAAFLVLAVTGLYIWMPRKWSLQALRPSVWFVKGVQGKARDWNWHNVIGVWSAPILIVLTITALPISYLWPGDLLNRLNGPEATATGAGPGTSPPAAPLAPPAAGTQRLDFEALLTTAQRQVPDWKQITMRLDGGATAGGRGGGGAGGGRGGAPGGRGGGGRGAQLGGQGSAAEAPRAPGAGGGARNAAQPVAFSIREAHSWPRTATTTLTLDPFTGSALSRAGYADLATGRQVRAWTRFLHTGEALGPIGQFFAGLASLGACVLVWTGFALAWRRFFGPRTKSASSASAPTGG